MFVIVVFIKILQIKLENTIKKAGILHLKSRIFKMIPMCFNSNIIPALIITYNKP